MEGAPFVKVAFRKVVRDRPCIIDRDPVQIIMPPRCTNIGDAEWVIVQHVLPLRRLEQMEADGYFEKGAVAEIKRDRQMSEQVRSGKVSDTVTMSRSMQSLREIEDRRTQTWGTEDDDNLLVWEIFHWANIFDPNLKDRVHTWVHPRSQTKLVSRPYLMPFHRWPFAKFDFEKTSRRWLAPRGLSAMLEGLQREVNVQHNARLDAMTLRNAPIYQIAVAAGFKAKNFRLIPGTVLELPVGSRLEPVIQDRSSFPEQVSEEQMLRNIAENYAGVYDSALTNQTSLSKARTATEIQAASQFAASVASFDTILFQLTMRELHEMIWQLWLDLGPDEIYIKVLGESGTMASKLIKKSDIAHSFKLMPTGTIANTNRALELAHAREAIQLYLNDQTGFINPFELRRWHLGLLTYRQARRLLNSPEQAQELTTLRQAAQQINQNPELQALLAGNVFSVPPDELERQKVEQLPRNPQDQF